MSSSFGSTKQHLLTSSQATLSNQSTLLDTKSLNVFTDQVFNYTDKSLTGSTTLALGAEKKLNHQVSLNPSSRGYLANNLTNPTRLLGGKDSRFSTLLSQPSLLANINEHSDLKQVKNPLLKVLNDRHFRVVGHNLLSYASELNLVPIVSDLVLTAQSTNNQLLPSERTVLQSSSLAPRVTQHNLTPLANSLTSRLGLESNVLAFSTGKSLHSASRLKGLNLTNFSHFAPNRFTFDLPYSALPSNNPFKNPLNFDTIRTSVPRTEQSSSSVNYSVQVKKTEEEVPYLIQGTRDESLAALNSTH